MKTNNGARKQVHVFYTGRVQGVGFRFTAQEFAHELGVQGWAKNLANGKVEVVAQAQEGALKEFLARINQYFARSVQDAAISWEDAADEFSSFEIRF